MMFGFYLANNLQVHRSIPCRTCYESFDVPGIAVAVIKDGKVIHSKGYGVRSLNTKRKLMKIHCWGLHPTVKLLRLLP
jgi:hypothetical protein